jgi:hypothetical protein
MKPSWGLSQKTDVVGVVAGHARATADRRARVTRKGAMRPLRFFGPFVASQHLELTCK